MRISFRADTPLARCGVIIFVLLQGCSRPQESAVTPLDDFRRAIAESKWSKAASLGNSVLLVSKDDPAILDEVARAHFETGDAAKAVGLLMDACLLDRFQDSARIRRIVSMFIYQGRLFDAIEFLKKSVDSRPGDHTLRRELFDYLVGTEQHAKAHAEGQRLILARQFDRSLLDAMLSWTRRDQESKSLEKMAGQYPADLRPLIGAAKAKMDRSQFLPAIEVLRAVSAARPDDELSTAYLARAYSLSAQMNELADCLGRANDRIWHHDIAWLALEQLATSVGDHQMSLVASRRAIEINPLCIEAHERCLVTLQALDTESQSVSEVISTLESRGRLLRDLFASHEQLKRNRLNAAALQQIAKSYRRLGQSWQAEAWSAVGLQSPDFSVEEKRQIESLRHEIIQQLRLDTPWQSWSVDSLAIDSMQSKDATARAPTFVAREFLARILEKPAMIADAPVDENQSSSWVLAETSTPILVDQAKQRDLVWLGRTAEGLDQSGIQISNSLGCGGGTIDFDLDGWPDLSLRDAGGTPQQADSRPDALMRNLDGRFLNVAQISGATDRYFGQGVAVGDVNEDGWPDLLMLNYGPNSLLINNGDGTFTDHSDSLRVGPGRWSTSGAIADVDGDGISDLVVLNYCDGTEPFTLRCEAEGMTGHRGCSPMRFDGSADQVFRGLSTGNFQDVSDQWLLPVTPGRGLGLIVGDFQGSGSNSILVANDMTENHFWTRAPDRSLRWYESAARVGLAGDAIGRAQGSMGIAVGDCDRDGFPDFYVTNFENESNTLHIGQGNQRASQTERWVDQTVAAGLSEPTLPMVGFGTAFVDFDLNGGLELITTNGHVDRFALEDKRSEYAQPMQVMTRQTTGRWTDSIGASAVMAKPDYLSRTHVGRALWTIDVDRDGKLDVVVTHQTEPVSLLINQTPTTTRHLLIELVGVESSRNAIGATVTIHCGAASRKAWRVSGDGYLASNQALIAFGTGMNERVDSVEINWPDGTIETHYALPTNSHWLAVQKQPIFRLN